MNNLFCRCALVLIPAAFFSLVNLQPQRSQSDLKTGESTIIAPTETNWTSIMGLVYRPAFNNLKEQIGSQTKDKKVDFSALQRDALILAEFTSRLHQWPDIYQFESTEKKQNYLETHRLLQTRQVQQHAAEIYKAAKTEQIAQAKESFVKMTHSCNICHSHKKSSWSPIVLKP